MFPIWLPSFWGQTSLYLHCHSLLQQHVPLYYMHRLWHVNMWTKFDHPDDLLGCCPIIKLAHSCKYRAKKNLNSSLHFRQAAQTQSCLPWAILSLLLFYLVGNMPGHLPIRQVGMKGYFPSSKICLYQTTGPHFFQALK